MRSILKEPLLHFLALGAALFAVFALLNDDDSGSGSQSREIVVTPGRTATLVAQFEKTWNRPPTSQEIDGLIEEHIREEILYREALALGLDRDDTIVRRRMRQKLEFLSEDILTLAEPTEEDLEEYLASHPDAYRLDSLFTFKQVFLNAKNRAGTIDADTQTLLATLRSKGPAADITEAGDRLMLEQSFEATPLRDVARLFGEEFATALAKTPTGSWQGPVPSGYGLHLVSITNHTEGQLPPLNEVRDAVLRDWSNERRNETNEAFYRNLRARYTVTIEEAPIAEKEGSTK